MYPWWEYLVPVDSSSVRTRLTDRLEDFVEDPNTGEAGGVIFNLKGNIVSMSY